VLDGGDTRRRDVGISGAGAQFSKLHLKKYLRKIFGGLPEEVLKIGPQVFTD